MEKDIYFIVRFCSVGGYLVLSDEEMKYQDWRDIKYDLRSIKTVTRTKKWKEALPEFDP